ncbi:MAG: LytTR family transcriptional regulator [Saprospiraceae bacterium]|nr:LytTR family transcriptional regulator [Saprospiraceae bacterium]
MQDATSSFITITTLNQTAEIGQIYKHNHLTVFCIWDRNRYKQIKAVDFLYMEADGNYSSIYLADGTSIYTSKPLKYWVEKLDAIQWLRIHQSFAVNPTKIEKVLWKNKQILVTGGKLLQASRRLIKFNLINL